MGVALLLSLISLSGTPETAKQTYRFGIMGGSGSTPRHVTVEEDDSNGVMRVSDSVARRLIGQPEVVEQDPEPENLPVQQIIHGVDPAEVDQLENYYKQRISSLEKKNDELFEEKKEEFAKTVAEVEQKFLKTTASPICEDLQAEVLKCYQSNPSQTLLCSSIVKEFNECVQKQREVIATKRG